MKRPLLLPLVLLLAWLNASAQPKAYKTQHLFLITFDGLRWEELFGGAVDSLMNDPAYVTDTTGLQQLFAAPTAEERRRKLMPWFWNTVGRTGQLYGNRWLDNKVNVTNPFLFSYPGYSEILTGFVDTRINSNNKVDNPNRTLLEWLNDLPEYNGRVAAFGSWDVFPYIINEQRSGIPVNAGFRPASGAGLSEREVFLNQMQEQVPSPWSSVRLDAFTHHYACEYIKRKHPRVVFLSYGETDDFAHDGRYDHYLKSAHQTDNMIKSLWEYVQSDPFYAGRTTFLITTDHGRGNKSKEDWRNHGRTYAGSNAIWLAVIGPDTPASGEMKKSGQWYQNQVAKTAAAFLGLEYTNTQEVGKVIPQMFR
jgi:hypothetical protein